MVQYIIENTVLSFMLITWKLHRCSYLALTMIGCPPLGGNNELSPEPLAPIAFPITLFTDSNIVCGPVGSVVDL